MTSAFAARVAARAVATLGSSATQFGFEPHVDCRKSIASHAVDAASRVTGAGSGTVNSGAADCARLAGTNARLISDIASRPTAVPIPTLERLFTGQYYSLPLPHGGNGCGFNSTLAAAET